VCGAGTDRVGQEAGGCARRVTSAIDLFCGAGGLTRGLIDAGICVLRGYDIDDRCRETYTRNNAGAEFVCRDVRTVRFAAVARLEGYREAEYRVLAACAPCQPFSKVRRNGRNDPRRALLAPVLEAAGALVPDVVLLENVPGLLSGLGSDIFREFVSGLEAQGYHAEWRVLDAKSYGVPQTRRRLVLLAGRGFAVAFPTPSHGPTAGRPYVTVRDAIGAYPAVAAGATHDGVANHTAASLAPQNLERIRHTPRDGGGRLDWAEPLVLSCHKSPRSYSDVYGRMWWDRPAPTLTGRCRSLSNGRFGHPEQHRAITLREAAALQSFPDDYVFYGAPTHAAVQIGNAVPVALAKALGDAILQSLGASREAHVV